MSSFCLKPFMAPITPKLNFYSGLQTIQGPAAFHPFEVVSP